MPKVLIVDDAQDGSAGMVRLLAAKGYRTRTESNGAAALLAAHEDLPDVILLDLATPILDGQEAIQALRHDPRTAHIPVIVLSGRHDDTQMADALVAGANVYFVKPPDTLGLISVVERLIALQPNETSTS